MISFGTGGWRAIIGKDFVYENIARVAMGIVALAKKEGKTAKPIVVGYDRRFLSQGAAKWVAEVLAGGGIADDIELSVFRLEIAELSVFHIKRSFCQYTAHFPVTHIYVIYPFDINSFIG